MQETHTTTCCFYMTTLRGDMGGGLWCCQYCGNFPRSCVLGMTSLRGPAEVWCLGIAFAGGILGRDGAEGERGVSPESLFYLACDGEIQINSCQSAGFQGQGLQHQGSMGEEMPA